MSINYKYLLSLHIINEIDPGLIRAGSQALTWEHLQHYHQNLLKINQKLKKRN